MGTYYIGNDLWGDSEYAEHSWMGKSKLAKQVKSGVIGTAKKAKKLVEDVSGVTAKNDYKKKAEIRDRVGESANRANEQFAKASKDAVDAHDNRGQTEVKTFLLRNPNTLTYQAASEKERGAANSRYESAKRKEASAESKKERAFQKAKSVGNTYFMRTDEAQRAKARYERTPLGRLETAKKKLTGR